MSTKHTPGPWHMINPHDEPYYEIWHGQIGEPDRECIAEYVREGNAALIAAAPALLEACKSIMRPDGHYEDCPCTGENSDGWGRGHKHMPNHQTVAICKQLRAALALCKKGEAQ